MKAKRASVVGLFLGLTVVAAVMPAAADGPPASVDFASPYQLSIWHGLYGGLHLGWGDAGLADGFVGGVQVGYNWQTGQMVYGLEADVSFSDISYQQTFFPGATVKASIDWLASARGRLGFLVTPRILAYGTAGIGFASASASASVPGLPGPSISDSDMGILFGIGLEGKVSDSMSLRVEYLSFGDLDVDVFRAGVNFKFGN